MLGNAHSVGTVEVVIAVRLVLLWNVLLTKYWGIFTVHFVFIIKI